MKCGNTFPVEWNGEKGEVLLWKRKVEDPGPEKKG